MLNSLQNFLNVVFPLITFPYVSRVLSVSGMGKYNFSLSIVNYFLLIAALGIDTFAVREGAKFRDNRLKFSMFASNVFTINLLSMLIAYLLLAILIIVVPSLHRYTIAICILSLQIFLTTIGVNWVYTVFEEYAYITLRNIIFKILSIILLFSFIRHANDYLNYAIITVIATSGSYICNLLYVKHFCDLRLNFRFNLKKYLKPILVIFASTVAIQIYVNSDTTMLGFMKGTYAVGIYNVSVKVYSIIASFIASILIVTIPRLSMLIGVGKKKEYIKLLRQLMDALIVIILPTTIGLFILSKDIVIMLGGRKYITSSPSLKILSLAILFKIFCSIFNECVLIPLKKENKSLIAFTVAAVINIGLNFILIPLLSERGAALTTVIAEFSAMLINMYYGKKIIFLAIKNKTSLTNIITVLISAFAMICVCLLIVITVHSMLIRVVLQIVLSIITYFLLLIMMKNPIARSLFLQFKGRRIKVL